jgi:hypothetical protein
VTKLAVVSALTPCLDDHKSSLILKDQARAKGCPHGAAVARDDSNVARSYRPRTSRGPRVQKLLATQQEVEQAGIPFSPEQVAITEVEQNVISHKSRWDDNYLDQMIIQASESLVRQRLDSLVQDHVIEKRTLVSLTRSAVDRFVRLGSRKRVRELKEGHARVEKSNLLTRITSVMFLMLAIDSCNASYIRATCEWKEIGREACSALGPQEHS